LIPGTWSSFDTWLTLWEWAGILSLEVRSSIRQMFNHWIMRSCKQVWIPWTNPWGWTFEIWNLLIATKWWVLWNAGLHIGGSSPLLWLSWENWRLCRCSWRWRWHCWSRCLHMQTTRTWHACGLLQSRWRWRRRRRRQRPSTLYWLSQHCSRWCLALLVDGIGTDPWRRHFGHWTLCIIADARTCWYQVAGGCLEHWTLCTIVCQLGTVALWETVQGTHYSLVIRMQLCAPSLLTGMYLMN
jgi:hypothetical protein